MKRALHRLACAAVVTAAAAPAMAAGQGGLVMVPYQGAAPDPVPAVSAPPAVPAARPVPAALPQPAAQAALPAQAPTRPAEPERLDGFGNDIPLSFAVKQIVPEGFLVNFAPGVNRDMSVSWHGGASWREVLEHTAQSSHLRVSYVGQLVKIEGDGAAPAPVAAAPAPAPKPVAAAPSPAPAPERPAPVAVAAPAAAQVAEAEPRAPRPAARTASGRAIAVAPPSPRSTAPAGGNGIWHAAAGETLDQVLGDWAEKSGWTVVVNTQMIYELQASADFNGDFISASAALVKSIQAKPQPLATFYRGNHALVISNAADATN